MRGVKERVSCRYVPYVRISRRDAKREKKRERERERERERKNASSWEANETPVKGGWTRVALGRARRKKNPDDY